MGIRCSEEYRHVKSANRGRWTAFKESSKSAPKSKQHSVCQLRSCGGILAHLEQDIARGQTQHPAASRQPPWQPGGRCHLWRLHAPGRLPGPPPWLAGRWLAKNRTLRHLPCIMHELKAYMLDHGPEGTLTACWTLLQPISARHSLS